MKIEGNRPTESQEISLRPQKLGQQEAVTDPNGVKESPQKVSQTDQVQLSGRAGEIAQLQQVIQLMPDIRTDKVEALKKSIQEGTYKMDSFRIAGKILEEI
jgi:flagellar biosynthesis anti-sigma factor FlgM